ncbi:YebC/PmpR family DNA-binding transcriptional regulator [Candidatus Dojkabacteria bacterium]|uniref:Probable transcriptional regulatory protein KC640_03705 n=1 Tax=Candidatus Dojkabacteria bacterium TaxID=2099670 RepID=A0A955I819_9BACT|nr:YebC/PmpR family DNA-binding transcriptional regulator [Candidatus Dojkabacteria bacterium]
MSGHSKWATIRRAKAVTDAKRGALFSRLSRDIIVAAQQGGGDPDMNFTLRLAVDRAKAANMPADNIDRAIKKGSGQLQGDQISEVTYEGYGPGNVPMLIDCQTDNTNRALTEVRLIMERGGGKLSAGNSVSWQFAEKGQIIIQAAKYRDSGKFGKEGTYEPVDADEALLEIMEIPGVEDVQSSPEEESGNSVIEIVTVRDELRAVHQQVEKLGYKIEQADLAKFPNEQVNVANEDSQKLQQLVEALEESEEVKSVWTAARVD